MNILLVLIPLSILLAIGAGIAFFWAVDHDQFDDLDTPKLLPLLDNPRADTGSSNAAAPGPFECGNDRRERRHPQPSALSAGPSKSAPSGKYRPP